MRAAQVLQKCLNPALGVMHALRRGVLMKAVDALVTGRRLTLIDVARSWPNAVRVRAPLKALDRLLSNGHVHAERERIYAGMVRWLVRNARSVIVIDIADALTPATCYGGSRSRSTRPSRTRSRSA